MGRNRKMLLTRSGKLALVVAVSKNARDLAPSLSIVKSKGTSPAWRMNSTASAVRSSTEFRRRKAAVGCSIRSVRISET